MIISPCKQKVITKEKQVEIRLLRFAVSLFRPVDGDALGLGLFQIFLTFTNYNENTITRFTQFVYSNHLKQIFTYINSMLTIFK